MGFFTKPARTRKKEIDRKSDMDQQADMPVRKTEGGKYGENAELASDVTTFSKEEQKDIHYFSSSKARNKALNRKIDEIEQGQ